MAPVEVTFVPIFSAHYESIVSQMIVMKTGVKRPRLNGGLRERPRRKAYLSVQLGQNLLKEAVRAGPPLLEVMRPPSCSRQMMHGFFLSRTRGVHFGSRCQTAGTYFTCHVRKTNLKPPPLTTLTYSMKMSKNRNKFRVFSIKDKLNFDRNMQIFCYIKNDRTLNQFNSNLIFKFSSLLGLTTILNNILILAPTSSSMRGNF